MFVCICLDVGAKGARRRGIQQEDKGKAAVRHKTQQKNNGVDEKKEEEAVAGEKMTKYSISS